MLTKSAIYQLKRRNPTSIIIIRKLTSAYDTQTGVKSINYQSIPVSRAIKLPFKQVHQQAPRVANEKVYYGTGGINLTDMQLIVDLNDMPPNWTFLMTDYVDIADQRYNIKEIGEHFESKSLVILTLSASEADNSNLIVPCKVFSNLYFNSVGT